MLQADESKPQSEGNHDVTDGHTAPEKLGVVIRIGLGPRGRFCSLLQFETAEAHSAAVDDHVEWRDKQPEHTPKQKPGLDPMKRSVRTEGVQPTIPNHKSKHSFIALSLEEAQTSQNDEHYEPRRVHRHAREPVGQCDKQKPAALEVIDVVDGGLGRIR